MISSICGSSTCNVSVSPLVATYPLVTVILSALCLSKVETGVRTFVGVALTVAGVVLLIVG